MIVVDGATHSQKDGVENNGGSLLEGWSTGLHAVPAWRSTGPAVECPQKNVKERLRW